MNFQPMWKWKYEFLSFVFIAKLTVSSLIQYACCLWASLESYLSLLTLVSFTLFSRPLPFTTPFCYFLSVCCHHHHQSTLFWSLAAKNKPTQPPSSQPNRTGNPYFVMNWVFLILLIWIDFSFDFAHNLQFFSVSSVYRFVCHYIRGLWISTSLENFWVVEKAIYNFCLIVLVPSWLYSLS